MMKIYQTIEELNTQTTGEVGIVIGNFDGVHLGHKKLLSTFVEKCKRESLTPILFTFSPHPKIFLDNSLKHFLIDMPRRRLKKVAGCGIESIVEIKFDANIQNLSAKEFIEESLASIKNLKMIYLGHDFSLGNGKKPAKDLLGEVFNLEDVEINELNTFLVSNEPVSSSIIRNAISNGDIVSANKLLGRSFSIVGSVINGYGVGKKKLVATANIEILDWQIYPKAGVYFTNTFYKKVKYRSVTNVGFRPSLEDEDNLSIETHIFDFEDEIYNEEIEVEYLKFHREEKQFSSVDELLKQIHIDIKARGEYRD